MFKELETTRLRLKNIGYEDTEFFYKEFSTPAVNTFLYDTQPLTSLAQAKEWVDFYLQKEPRNRHRWIIVEKRTNQKIGTCGFHCWDLVNATIQIGCQICAISTLPSRKNIKKTPRSKGRTQLIFWSDV